MVQKFLIEFHVSPVRSAWIDKSKPPDLAIRRENKGDEFTKCFFGSDF
ncbi:Uncharacterized protein dnm_023240 [Desulfonema magnum]|uniref:Uncharacterized protein n=1 Tax=Desulfonema magnum TaxID=45655 RepID=A0A975BJ36_9BACT|nr:Uncharacterized protein dnm_023240 [Desulfonema magnum]